MVVHTSAVSVVADPFVRRHCNDAIDGSVIIVIRIKSENNEAGDATLIDIVESAYITQATVKEYKAEKSLCLFSNCLLYQYYNYVTEFWNYLTIFSAILQQ